MKINIYIDGNNLYRSAKELGYEIDYKKFRGWVSQKYNYNNIYLFIGFIPTKESFYNYLKDCGFILIFKQTALVSSSVKGNCDAEMVLKIVSDFYTKKYDSCILITGDEDFGCLVEFLKENKIFHSLIAPDKMKCSFQLKNKYVKITFLNGHYHKFSTLI